MKVGIIFFKYPLYGGGSYFQEFVDALCLKSKNVVLIASHYPKEEFVHPKNLIIKWVSFYNFLIIGDLIFNWNIFWTGIFSREFRSVDIINVVSARGVLAAKLLGKILKKPVVCTIEIINSKQNGFWDSVFYRIQRWLFSFNFDKIICWSHYYADILISWGIKKEVVKILPGGINVSRYNPSIDGSKIRKMYPEKALIVFAKPLYEYNRKTAEILLEAVAMLGNEASVHILLGDGEQRNIIEQKIQALDLNNAVSFMSVVSITEIPKYIAASDIIVLPFSYAATTSRSLLEAMAIGKPIVTTAVGEISMVVENEKEAILVNPNEKEVSRAIQRLLDDKELALRLGKNARKKVEEKYSIDNIVRSTVAIYNEVIVR